MLWEKTEAPRRAAILSHYGPLRSPLYPGASGLSRVFFCFLAFWPLFPHARPRCCFGLGSVGLFTGRPGTANSAPLDGKSRHICGVFLLSGTILRASGAGGGSGFAGFLHSGRRVAGATCGEMAQAGHYSTYHFSNLRIPPIAQIRNPRASAKSAARSSLLRNRPFPFPHG